MGLSKYLEVIRITGVNSRTWTVGTGPNSVCLRKTVYMVVPKSYHLEGQLRTTRNEHPIWSAFGNSRQVQYGDLLAFSLRSDRHRGQSMRRRRKRTMFYNIPIQNPPL